MFKPATVLSLFAFALSASAQVLTINTPSNVISCEPTLLTWSGGVPPYFVDLLDGNNIAGGSIQSLVENSTETSFKWTPTNQPGSSLDLQIRDNSGATQNTAPFPVASPPAGANSCLTGGGGGSSSSSSSSSSSGAPAPTSTSSSSAAPVPTSSKSSSSSSAPGTVVGTTGAGSSTTPGTGSATSPAGTATHSSSASPAGTSSSASTSASAKSGALNVAVPAAGALGAVVAAVFFA